MTMKMRAAGRTDVGRLRSNNEDTFLVAPSLLLVADGMGGAAAGEVASGLARDIIGARLSGVAPSDENGAERVVRDAIGDADAEIRRRMAGDRSLDGMGTTVVTAFRFGDRLLIGYVGDSRAYAVKAGSVRNGERAADAGVDLAAATGILPAPGSGTGHHAADIVRLTRDHSVVMDMVVNGVIEEKDIRTHPFRNQITRCLGSAGKSEPDLVWYDIADGDRVVICSDGLWEMITEDLIQAIVQSSADPDTACERLVVAANNAGGMDNITVVTAMFSQG